MMPSSIPILVIAFLITIGTLVSRLGDVVRAKGSAAEDIYPEQFLDYDLSLFVLPISGRGLFEQH